MNATTDQMTLDEIQAIHSALLGDELQSQSELLDVQARHKTVSSLVSELVRKPEYITVALADILPSGGLTVEDHRFCLTYTVAQDPKPGFVVDAFGLYTRSNYAAKWGPLDGTVAPWGFRQCFEHDVIEWYGLLRAIERAQGSFVIAELGAGWGPWITAGSVFARRAGIETVRAIAVEADETRFSFINQHLADNGVADVEVKLMLGAIAPEPGLVLFPRMDDSTKDMGFAAVFEEDKSAQTFVDYRGEKLDHQKTRAYDLNTVFEDVDHIDFLHVDIQGAELEVLKSGPDLVTQKCRHILMATHSRAVEWGIAEILMARGWVLEKELPCGMHHGDFWRHSGRTWPLVVRDGAQFWRNPGI
jgi:FkbM family methyltransferase